MAPSSSSSRLGATSICLILAWQQRCFDCVVALEVHIERPLKFVEDFAAAAAAAATATDATGTSEDSVALVDSCSLRAEPR